MESCPGLWKSHINEAPVVEKGFYDLHSHVRCSSSFLSSHLEGYMVVVSAAERAPPGTLSVC